MLLVLTYVGKENKIIILIFFFFFVGFPNCFQKQITGIEFAKSHCIFTVFST